MKVFHYILREFKNLFEFYLIPLLTVILPHRIYYPIFKVICRNTLFYRNYSQDSYKNAHNILTKIENKEGWDCKVKLLHLIDIADFWLARFRPKKLKKLLRKNGEWDVSNGYLALSIHFGPGYVTLLDLKERQFNPFFVYADPQIDFKFQSFIEYQYRKARKKHINHLSGSMAITTGGGYNKIKKVIENNGTPIILFDAPQLNKPTKFKLSIFGRKYKVASGFINLICNENIKFQMYSVKLNYNDGYKYIDIEKLSSTNSSQSLITSLSHFFENLIVSNPEQWYFWKQSAIFFKIDDT